MWKGPDIINAINNPKLKKIEADAKAAESQERVKLVETVSALAQTSRELQQPIRSLINKLDETDTISLPGIQTALPKESAKSVLEKGHRAIPVSYYIDQRFRIQALSTKRPNAWDVTLKVGSVSFVAKLTLSHDDANSLLAEFQEAHARGSEIAPDLQVTARINHKGIQSAEVVGLGDPRPNAIGLSKALASAKKATPKSPMS